MINPTKEIKMTNTPLRLNEIFNVWGLSIALAVAVILAGHDATAAQAPVTLGAAARFAVLAATTVTSRGATTVNGHLGISPGTAVTGSLKVSGAIHAGDPTAAQAQRDLTT